jgi:hypothetical protein
MPPSHRAANGSCGYFDIISSWSFLAEGSLTSFSPSKLNISCMSPFATIPLPRCSVAKGSIAISLPSSSFVSLRLS